MKNNDNIDFPNSSEAPNLGLIDLEPRLSTGSRQSDAAEPKSFRGLVNRMRKRNDSQSSFTSPMNRERSRTPTSDDNNSFQDTSPKKLKIKGELKNGSFKNLSLIQTLNLEGVNYRGTSFKSESQTSSQRVLPETTATKAGIWKLKFSLDGDMLACGRNDGTIILWERKKFGILAMDHHMKLHPKKYHSNTDLSSESSDHSFNSINSHVDVNAVFEPRPTQVYTGHHSAITDLCWSSSEMLLSASLDCTVRLWHPKHSHCLSIFQHTDCVSSIMFNPAKDSEFVSGAMDGTIRTWDIAERKLIGWKEVTGEIITSICITNDGLNIIAGTFTGQCIFYNFKTLNYHTQISVGGGKTKTSTGKIVSILQSVGKNDSNLLVTSGDSRVRLYNLRDKSLLRTYKGSEHGHGSSGATFSQDGEFIIIGGEDKHCVVWDVNPADSSHQYSGMLSTIVHKKLDTARATGYERFGLSSEYITGAVFAPWKTTDITQIQATSISGMVLVVCDDQGNVLVYENL